jgi:two-component system alkaline phosphatase synthesis response regulator PhoP
LTKRVLIADDETFVVKILKDRFTHWGYLVETAFDGKETLEKVEYFNPHLIILDLKMPVLDGMKVLEETKNTYPHIGVLILTASQSEITFKTCMKKGVDGYILKPFKPETIKEQVERALKKTTKYTSHA